MLQPGVNALTADTPLTSSLSAGSWTYYLMTLIVESNTSFFLNISGTNCPSLPAPYLR